MGGTRIGIRVYGNGLDAHAAGGSGNAAGNFATVGDKNFFKHVTGSC